MLKSEQTNSWTKLVQELVQDCDDSVFEGLKKNIEIHRNNADLMHLF